VRLRWNRLGILGDDVVVFCSTLTPSMGIAIPLDNRDDWWTDSYASRKLAIGIYRYLLFGAIRSHRLIAPLFSKASSSGVRKFLVFTTRVPENFLSCW